MKKRILIVDDNEDIHIQFSLGLGIDMEDDEEDSILDQFSKDEEGDVKYSIDHAYQGEEAIQMITKSVDEGREYDLVFMDIRMPPGIDGFETMKKLFKIVPQQNVAICTAYSDYSLQDMKTDFCAPDREMFYFPKPYTLKDLRNFVEYSVVTKNLDEIRKYVL